MSKIKNLVEELKSEIEKEYGININISIHAHSSNNDLDFSEGNKICNKLLQELGGKKRIYTNPDYLNFGNKEFEGELASFSIFTDKVRRSSQ